MECVRPQGSSAETLQPPLLPQSERHTPGGRLRALPAADPSLWPPPLLSASCFLSAACPRALEPHVAFPTFTGLLERQVQVSRPCRLCFRAHPQLSASSFFFSVFYHSCSVSICFPLFVPLCFFFFWGVGGGGGGGGGDVCVCARACLLPPTSMKAKEERDFAHLR